jgi:tRNA (guanine37-N1)-methyltransferase
MKFDVVTIFPRMFDAPLTDGVVARGVQAGLVDVVVHDLRDFTTDRHRVVDDVPYGGGPGMVLKPEPLFEAVDHIRASRGTPGAIVLTSPQGKTLTQAEAARLAALEHVVILCGRYEGVDERVREHVATEEISIGDYVLSGGELAAMVIIDVVSRLVPGVVGDERSVSEDSFSHGLLDHPHYTRPAEYRGWTVPEVLLSGHHREIERWRRNEAVRRTRERRPEMLSGEGADHERD